MSAGLLLDKRFGCVEQAGERRFPVETGGCVRDVCRRLGKQTVLFNVGVLASVVRMCVHQPSDELTS